MKINDFREMVDNDDKKTIAIDFDGVIHKNSKGFYDGTIYDKPIDGVEKALNYLSKSHKLVIYTCKANPNRPLVNKKTGVDLIWDWLKKYDFDKYIDDICYIKPNAKFYIDDKAINFKSWNQTLKDIRE